MAADGEHEARRAEGALMQRVAQGDARAFEQLIGSHLQSIHHYCTRLSGSRADADDVAQETFLNAWRGAAGFKPGKARLTTWLHRIAHNLWIDELRRRPQADMGGSAERPLVPGPDAAVRAADDAAAVNAALSRLPDNQRSAIVLCLQQGLANREAAVVLGIRRRALESLLARARRRLKAELASTYGGTNGRHAHVRR